MFFVGIGSKAARLSPSQTQHETIIISFEVKMNVLATVLTTLKADQSKKSSLPHSMTSL